MRQKQKPQRQYASLASLILAGLAVFFVIQPSVAGPITNGPGNPPYAKVSVYQGVISIIPGGGTDSIMEIGNAGRDIASTGSIYLRPGTINGGGGDVVIAPQNTVNEGGEVVYQGAGTYPVWFTDLFQNRYRIYSTSGEIFSLAENTGNLQLWKNGSKLCFADGTCQSTAAIGAGSNPTLDQVLAAGNSGDAKTILLKNQGGNAQSFGASKTADFSGTSYTFLAPYILANGGYNNVTRANDSGLIFSPGGGLTIGSWYNTTTKGIRIGGGQDPLLSSALSVNNNLYGVGSSGDAIAAFANSANAAVYAQQDGTGYAGYFSGKASITGNLYLGGRLKPQAVQVCQVGTDTCLGRYYYTTGTSKDPASPSTIKLFYETTSATSTTLGSVTAFTTGPSVPDCEPNGILIQRNDPPLPQSQYNVSNCSGTLVNEFVFAGTAPYGSPEYLCRSKTSTVINILSYRDSLGCVNVNQPNRTVYALDVPVLKPTYNPAYELR